VVYEILPVGFMRLLILQLGCYAATVQIARWRVHKGSLGVGSTELAYAGEGN